MTIVWIALYAVLLALAVACLVILLRMRERGRKAERWFERQILAIREEMRAQPEPQPAPAPTPQAQPQRRPAPQPAPASLDLTGTLNEMLAGKQPYNFIEAVQAMAPTLLLQRLTPCAGIDAFARDVLLEPGGDGLFAAIDGNNARLYPNYSRFSATLDPKPLFEDARHGARIHSILRPALLRRQADDTWLLVERGRVQMRQGG